jgi:hypothetical protein
MPRARWHNVPLWQPISRYLVIFRQLIESEAALTDSLGDDVLQTDEGPAADEEDVGRVGGKWGLLRAHEAALGGHRWLMCLRAS